MIVGGYIAGVLFGTIGVALATATSIAMLALARHVVRVHYFDTVAWRGQPKVIVVGLCAIMPVLLVDLAFDTNDFGLEVFIKLLISCVIYWAFILGERHYGRIKAILKR